MQLVEVPKTMSHSEQIVDPPALVLPEGISVSLPIAELVYRGGPDVAPRPELAANSGADNRRPRSRAREVPRSSTVSLRERISERMGKQNRVVLEAEKFQCVDVFLSISFHLSSSRTSTGDGCLFHLEPRTSDLKPMEKTSPRETLDWSAQQETPILTADHVKAGLVSVDAAASWNESGRER